MLDDLKQRKLLSFISLIIYVVCDSFV
jgi:hypothetical protein